MHVDKNSFPYNKKEETNTLPHYNEIYAVFLCEHILTVDV